MSAFKTSFFSVFRSDHRTNYREALQRFFENRNSRITSEIAAEFADDATLDKLIGLGLIERDGENGEYRLDDRVERFFDEMLGAVEVAQAEWLTGHLEELNRWIQGCQSLTDPAKSDVLLRKICRQLRACNSRAQRHLEEIKSAVDYDYRAGSDYEIKLMNLKWHLERAHSYGHAISELDHLLRTSAFFQVRQETELLSLRSRLIRRCGQVGDALINIYQLIEEYLNRVQRDYARARKLIRLRSLIERHEHLTATNLETLAREADGPWFREFRFRTSLDPGVIDSRPELLGRALARAGMGQSGAKTRRVELEDPIDEIPPQIDWSQIYEVFAAQPDDLFVFLGRIRIEGRPLTEEERIDGFCAILSSEDWDDFSQGRPFNLAAADGWEYAVVQPPASTLATP